MSDNRYGITQQFVINDGLDGAAENLRRNGFALIDSGLDAREIDAIAEAYDVLQREYTLRHTERMLTAIHEEHTLRMPLSMSSTFLELALNSSVIELCKRTLGEYFILNQQNGITNPPNGEAYSQGKWHRDLPYQHLTLSRPIMMNALYCVDDFSLENGATRFIRGSHRDPEFPSDQFASNHGEAVTAPAGTFIVADAMTYHTGGINTTEGVRRAVNHVFSIPQMAQQISIPAVVKDRPEDPTTARILGYDVHIPGSVEDFLAARARGARSHRDSQMQ